jgi:hypothetical protein
MKTEAQLREAALPPSSAPPPGARSKKGCRRRARGQSHSLGFPAPPPRIEGASDASGNGDSRKGAPAKPPR